MLVFQLHIQSHTHLYIHSLLHSVPKCSPQVPLFSFPPRNLNYSWGITTPTKSHVSTPTILHQQADTLFTILQSHNNKGVTLQLMHSFTYTGATVHVGVWWNSYPVFKLLTSECLLWQQVRANICLIWVKCQLTKANCTLQVTDFVPQADLLVSVYI